MAVMIKLDLPATATTLEAVKQLPGLQGLALDSRFGVVSISPREHLYVVRVDSVDDLEQRRALSPEILGVYGDVRIST
jgi:hypothetical protein